MSIISIDQVTQTKLEITYDYSDPYDFTTAILVARKLALKQGYNQAHYLRHYFEGSIATAIFRFRFRIVPRGTILTSKPTKYI
jgi:hypothetical protein